MSKASTSWLSRGTSLVLYATAEPITVDEITEQVDRHAGQID